jgi:hypothetical protein
MPLRGIEPAISCVRSRRPSHWPTAALQRVTDSNRPTSGQSRGSAPAAPAWTGWELNPARVACKASLCPGYPARFFYAATIACLTAPVDPCTHARHAEVAGAVRFHWALPSKASPLGDHRPLATCEPQAAARHALGALSSAALAHHPQTGQPGRIRAGREQPSPTPWCPLPAAAFGASSGPRVLLGGRWLQGW